MMRGGDNETTLDQRLLALVKDFNKSAVLSTAPNYEQAECGWVHPLNTSMMKIRDNGCIDIFVGTDNGIRIDPNYKSINIISSHMKEHLGDFHSWISDFSITDVKGPWTLNAIDIYVNAKKSINVKAGIDVNITAAKNIDMKATNVTIGASNTMNLNAGNTLNIKAGKISAVANLYDWN